MEPRHQRTPSLVAGIEALVHSNVLISASATSVAVTTILLTDHSLRPTPLFIVFAATMFVYSANRFTDLAEDEQNVPSRAAFTRRYGRYCLGVGAVLYLGAVVLALAWELPRAEFLLLPLVVAGLYSIGGLKRRLLVKNLLVGVSWGIIPLGVGVYYGDVWRSEILFLFAHVTAMLTVAAVVFDIKDIEGDAAAGIRTLPNVLGPAATRRLATVANLAVAVTVLGVVAVGIVPRSFLAMLAGNPEIGGYVARATPDRGPLFYGFVVDGEHIFLALVVGGLEILPAVLPG
jgi:4-hydroxybenzoate polyprenyltransferase